MKRYCLVIPQELFDEVQRLASERHTSTVDLMRQFIKLGLLAANPDTSLIIKDGDTEREIILL